MSDRALVLDSPRDSGFPSWRRLVTSSLERIEEGRLVLLEGGSSRTFGDAHAEPGLEATIRVHDAAFHAAIAARGSLGAGESFARGEWTTDDLPAAVRIVLRNMSTLDPDRGWSARIVRPLLRAAHALNANTRAGSRRNIAAHYDLGNDFFALFLDDTMTYSCGIFETEESTLREASLAKLERVCAKLALTPADRVLEIGTGWGSFAIHAASRYGCHVTTTTISGEQRRLAEERVARAGLADRVTILCEDYRDLRGRYDRIVSIEMIEAVGHRYYDEYVTACSRLLEADGMMLLQAITIADQAYDEHLRTVDFIKAHVFPGCNIPSLAAIVASLARASDLGLFHLEEQGAHYARTLRCWRESFMGSLDRARSLGLSDEFLRGWEFYLAYCEAGFTERYIRNVQALLVKPRCRRAPVQPPL